MSSEEDVNSLVGYTTIIQIVRRQHFDVTVTVKIKC